MNKKYFYDLLIFVCKLGLNCHAEKKIKYIFEQLERNKCNFKCNQPLQLPNISRLWWINDPITNMTNDLIFEHYVLLSQLLTVIKGKPVWPFDEARSKDIHIIVGEESTGTNFLKKTIQYLKYLIENISRIMLSLKFIMKRNMQ